MKKLKVTPLAGSEKLKEGERYKLAERTGYSYTHVCHVVNGKRPDVHGIITRELKAMTRRRK
mgnify:CR=1 FL=1